MHIIENNIHLFLYLWHQMSVQISSCYSVICFRKASIFSNIQIEKEHYYTINYIFLLFFIQMSCFNKNFLQQKSKSNHTQSALISNSPIHDRYYLKELVKIYPHYNIYEGVDSEALKLVTIYLKPTISDFTFSKKIKEEIRQKISPSVKWVGVYKLDKSAFNVQIHEKYGPSLKNMFSYVQEPLKQKDFLLLMYQLIRLVEKFAAIGYVYRQLDMQHIVFDSKPQKNDLFVLNVFPLRKKGEESTPLNSRFCSRGAHLGLRASHKDDLESICYILLNIFSRGTFLKKANAQLLQQAKAQIDFSSFKGELPQIFKMFYNYTINLNYADEVNYFQWRSQLYNLLGKDVLSHPYGWMTAKNFKQSTESLSYVSQEKDSDCLQEEGLTQELEDQLKPEDRHNLIQVTNKYLQNKKR